MQFSLDRPHFSPFCPHLKKKEKEKKKQCCYFLCCFHFEDCILRQLCGIMEKEQLLDYHQAQMGDAWEICCEPEVRLLIQSVMSHHRRMVTKAEDAIMKNK